MGLNSRFHFGFRERFVLLGVVFLLGYGCLTFVAGRTLALVKVNGPLYQEVIEDKDLIADILPPALYMAEPYLVALQIAAQPDLDGRRHMVRQLKIAIEQYRARHAYWTQRLNDPDLRKVLIEDSHEAAKAFCRALEEEFIPVVERAVTASKLRESATALEPAFLRHRTTLLGALPRAQKRVTDHEEEARRAVHAGTFGSLVVAVLFIVVVGTAGWLVVRSTLRSVGLLIDRMREMAEADADLSTRLEIHSTDEAGQLARWFNAFLDKIAGLVHAVKRSSIQLTSTATEMSATSHEQEATINDFGASANQIAAAVKQISATAAELMQTMQEVRKAAEASVALADEGRTGLQDMEATMGQLAGSSASISSKLSVINEKANEITSVVTTITKVADQTNLLSVNAAIEAEKSGEYGRGFLVVAREIRRLADQTAGATLDIDQTVNQMRSAVSAGVMEMDKFTDQVRRSVAEVEEVSHKLARIIEQVELVTQRFETVTEGMGSQVEGAQQIDHAMASLSAGVRRTQESLGEFTSAADDMRGAVESLKVEVGKFRLAE
jgi:methyl-accepting chemotaxis protein WspA